MQKIHVLDTVVANQIAAGEVVDRPAAVIKELVENSIDAGATAIEVEITQGGTEYLRVTDNGSGMSREDAILSLERHATSKIVSADDLHLVQTLGFRGEALPSIASVSKFKLVTRTAEQELASSILVEGGHVIEIDSCGGNVGTSITVEDLFFNLPARRKFLKTITTETRYINDLITKLALSAPYIKFSLKNNERLAFKTSGNGNLAECIHALFGREISECLLPVELVTDNIKLSGYVGNPAFTKNNRAFQFAFINRRSITSKLIYKALDNAYQSKVARGTHAFALLNLSINTHQVDVNVHPQKQEIKFSDESGVFKTVYRALMQALEYPLSAVKEDDDITSSTKSPHQEELTAPSVNTISNPQAKQSIQPTNSHQSVVERKFVPAGEQSIWRVDDPEASILQYLERKKDSSYEPIATAEQTLREDHCDSMPSISNSVEYVESAPVQPPIQTDILEQTKIANIPIVIGQFLNKYILAALDKELYIIDQHAAHERVIYDGITATNKELMVQDLLVAEFVQLLKQEMELIQEYLTDFAAVGLKISVAGRNTIRIESTPASIPASQIKEFFGYMLTRLSGYSKPSIADFQREMAHSISCKAAIKAGDHMSVLALQKLVERLYLTKNPFTCPHGRPLLVKFSDSELNKLFKRS